MYNIYGIYMNIMGPIYITDNPAIYIINNSLFI